MSGARAPADGRTVDRPTRRGTIGLVLALAVWLGAPGVAMAQAVAGGPLVAVVRSVPANGVRVEVRGTDLYVAAEPGHDVVVAGYRGEPFLRIDPSGTVSVNDNSPVLALATADGAAVGGPVADDATAPPVWRAIGTGGTYRWHDHRAHWMVDAPAADGPVPVWSVPLTVDGRAATVEGEFRWPESGPGPWWVLAALAALVGLVWWAGSRPRALAVFAVAAAAAAVPAAVAGAVADQPVGLGGWWAVALTGLAAVVGLAGMAGLASGRRAVGWWCSTVALVLLAGWLGRALPLLWAPLTAGPLPGVVVRALAAVVAALVGAGLVVAVRDAWSGSAVVAAGAVGGGRPATGREP